jgi:ATP-dependent Clp protease ATP-binding subunit ClpA
MLPQHMLLAILDEGKSVPLRVLLEASVDIKAAAERLRRELKRQTPALFNQDLESPLGKHSRRVICNKYLPSAIPFLGRQEELERAVSALTEARKSVVVVGEAGVGKTAFIRELECRLSKFFSKAESPYGGLYELKKEDFLVRVEDDEQREANFDDVIKGIIDARGFLFIEGIEVLLGMGFRSRSTLANKIHDFLGSGDLLVVATATASGLMSCEMESGEIISLFDQIHLSEPSRDRVYEILSAARDILEADYPVDIENAALLAAVDLPYELGGLVFPAKAVQLLEEVCLAATLSAKPGEKALIDSEKITDFIKL